MVKISAEVSNSKDQNDIVLRTGDKSHSIMIPSKASGFGSSANGGELLFLALAVCYSNDIYREAEQRNINIVSVQVEAEGDFDGIPGHPVENVLYHVTIEADASEQVILELIQHTDTVAEIHNTLRQATQIKLGKTRAISNSV